MSKLNLEKAKQILKETKQLTPETIRKGVSIFNKKIVGKLTGLNGEEKTVLPSAFAHFVTPDTERGYDGITKITMPKIDSSIDSNLQSKNIKTGITLFGVQGSCDPQIAEVQDKQLDITQNGNYNVYPDYGNDGLTNIKINVNIPPAIGGNVNTSGGTASSGSISAGKIGYVNGEGIVGKVEETLKLKTTPMTSSLDTSKQILNFETEKSKEDRIFRQGARWQGYESGASLAKTLEITPEKLFLGQNIAGVTGTAGISDEVSASTVPEKTIKISENHKRIEVKPKLPERGFSSVIANVSIEDNKFTPFDVGVRRKICSATATDNFKNGELVGIKMSGTPVEGPLAPITPPDGEEILDVHFSPMEYVYDGEGALSKPNYMLITKKTSGLEEEQGIYFRLYTYNEDTKNYQEEEKRKQQLLDFTYIETDFRIAGCEDHNKQFALDGDLFPIIFINDPTTNTFKTYMYSVDGKESIMRAYSGRHIIVFKGMRYENSFRRYGYCFHDYLSKPGDNNLSILVGMVSEELLYEMDDYDTRGTCWNGSYTDSKVIDIFRRGYLNNIYTNDDTKNKDYDFINILDAYWGTEGKVRDYYGNDDYSPFPCERKVNGPVSLGDPYTLTDKFFTNIVGDINIYYNKEKQEVKEMRQDLDKLGETNEEIPQKYNYNYIFYNYNPSIFNPNNIECSPDLKYMILNSASGESKILKRKRIDNTCIGTLYNLKGASQSISEALSDSNISMIAFEAIPLIPSVKGKIEFSYLRTASHENLIISHNKEGKKIFFKIPVSQPKYFIKKIHNSETARLNDIDGIGLALEDIPSGWTDNIQVLLLREESKKLKILGEE